MRKRLGGLVAAAAILFAACSGAATAVPATPAPSTASTAPASAAAPASTAPSGSPVSALDAAIFGTNYKPPTGAKTGGTIVMGEWQPPDNLNPFYSNSATTAEAVGP